MKLDYKDFEFVFTPEVVKLLDLFKEHDYEIRLVGGAVRDILLGKEPNDLDFATTATLDQMKAMFSKEDNIEMINPKGEKHGTITARINDKENFEITTLRKDVDTNNGRHAEVGFITDWELDANRRDLTINSMFLGMDGTVYDYCGGWEDLKKRKVEFVGDASARIEEDHQRILRYFRFCARFSEDPTKRSIETEEAIRKNVAGLVEVSGLRIWSELKEILSSEYAGPLLGTMLRLGIGSHIGLPDDLNLEDFMTVWKRTGNKPIQHRF